MLKYNILAFFKLIASFRISDWELDDYPILIKGQDTTQPQMENSKVAAYVAMIIHWSSMIAVGDTREEALSKLKQLFHTYKQSYNRLPRPGTHVPFFSELTVEEKEDINKTQEWIPSANEFLESIGWPGELLFITNETNLEELYVEIGGLSSAYEKINQMYGVDVSDIPGGNLIEILKRIKTHEHDRPKAES